MRLQALHDQVEHAHGFVAFLGGHGRGRVVQDAFGEAADDEIVRGAQVAGEVARAVDGEALEQLPGLAQDGEADGLGPELFAPVTHEAHAFEVHEQRAVLAEHFHAGHPLLRGVGQRDRAHRAVADEVNAVILEGRPGMLRHHLHRVDADVADRVHEGERHIDDVRAGLADDAAGQFVRPVVGLRGDVIRRRGEENPQAAEGADGPVAHELPGLDERVIEQVAVRDADLHLVLLRGGDDRVALGHGGGHGFFDQHVRAGLHARSTHARGRAMEAAGFARCETVNCKWSVAVRRTNNPPSKTYFSD